jgi:mannitol-1-phosphate/altronate dehydrogenase
MPLSDRTVARLPSRVEVPRYDRRTLTPGVVHMSVGAFHRSHQAVFFDDLANCGERDWSIVGVGLRRPRLRTALLPQDGLYTVVSRSPRGDRARVVGAMSRYMLAPEDGTAVVDAMSNARTAMVTLTITRDAYDVTDQGADRACGALDYLVEALRRRRRAGVAPFTVVSCDNLPRNGDVARAAVLAAARRHDRGLARWVEERVAFPNGMVDRITPRTRLSDRAMLARDFGVLDRWPVMTEPYSEWVLENRFCNRRPPLEQVGVRFVEDVTPYALMKTRLLNAAHCAIGFLGSLAGLRRTHHVMDDPLLSLYVRQLMADEITPLLPAVPGVDLVAYRRTLLARLANPKIGDELSRLCRAGTAKVETHLVPSVVQAIDRGAPHHLLTLALAGWIRHMTGVDDAGRPLELDDALADRLRGAARHATADSRPLLAGCGLGELLESPDFASALSEALRELERGGVRAAIARQLEPELLAA